MPESKFLPVTFANLEEGDLLKDADSMLVRLQSAMADHLNRHGVRADGAKGRLRLDVEFECIDASKETECIYVTTKMVLAEPPRPKAVRQAFPEDNGDGGHVLLMRRPPANSKDHPDQTVMFEEPASIGGEEQNSG